MPLEAVKSSAASAKPPPSPVGQYAPPTSDGETQPNSETTSERPALLPNWEELLKLAIHGLSAYAGWKGAQRLQSRRQQTLTHVDANVVAWLRQNGLLHHLESWNGGRLSGGGEALEQLLGIPNPAHKPEIGLAGGFIGGQLLTWAGDELLSQEREEGASNPVQQAGELSKKATEEAKEKGPGLWRHIFESMEMILTALLGVGWLKGKMPKPLDDMAGLIVGLAYGETLIRLQRWLSAWVEDKLGNSFGGNQGQGEPPANHGFLASMSDWLAGQVVAVTLLAVFLPKKKWMLYQFAKADPATRQTYNTSLGAATRHSNQLVVKPLLDMAGGHKIPLPQIASEKPGAALADSPLANKESIAQWCHDQRRELGGLEAGRQKEFVVNFGKSAASSYLWLKGLGTKWLGGSPHMHRAMEAGAGPSGVAWGAFRDYLIELGIYTGVFVPISGALVGTGQLISWLLSRGEEKLTSGNEPAGEAARYLHGSAAAVIGQASGQTGSSLALSQAGGLSAQGAGIMGSLGS